MYKRKYNKKAIIIGAGPAGLTAAYRLLTETKIIPIIYEESKYVGGLSKTINYKGNRIDIGGHRFFSKNQLVNDIWEKIMPTQKSSFIDASSHNLQRSSKFSETDPEKTDQVMLIRNRVSRIYHLGVFFDYPISLKLSTFKKLGILNTLKIATSYMSSLVKKGSEKNLEGLYINRFGSHLYKMFFEGYTEKVWGIHPSQISPEWGFQRVRGVSLVTLVKDMLIKLINKKYSTKEASLIEKFKYPKLGPGQLWEVMANEITKMGGEIKLNSKVTNLIPYRNKIKYLEIKSRSGKIRKIFGDFIFSSMPIKNLINSIKTNVPNNVYQIASGLEYRNMIVVGLLVKKMKIKNNTNIKTLNNNIPDNWIYIQEGSVKIGRIQIYNNWSPYMLKDHKQTLWLGLEYFCNQEDRLWKMEKKEFIEFAINELTNLKLIDKENVIDSVHIKIDKAYPSYTNTFNDLHIVQKYLDRYDNLYCLGRNGQHHYNNMDHSMLTAIEAVDIIKNNKKDKSILWKVNTEKDYHEKK